MMSSKKLEDEKFKTILKQSPSSSKKRSKTNLKALKNRKLIRKQLFKNEAAMNIEEFELERTSTPNLVNICEHCDHDHARVSN